MRTDQKELGLWLSDLLLSRCICKCWKIKWLCLNHFLRDGILEWAQGSAAGTASWGSVPTSRRADHSLYKLLLLECFFFFPLLAESKLLRQEAQDTGLWQYVSYSFVNVDFWGACGVFQIGGFCQEVVLCRQSEMWLLSHFTGGEGHTFYRSLRYAVPSSLCTLFCFPKTFFFFLPSLNDLLTSWTFLTQS